MSPDLIFVGFILFIIASLIAGRKFLFNLLKVIWNFFSAILLYIFSGKGFRLAELMIVAAIIAVLVAIAIPNFRTARMQARDKACYANMRVIQGAVEMYNMDQKSNDENSQHRPTCKRRLFKIISIETRKGLPLS